MDIGSINGIKVADISLREDFSVFKLLTKEKLETFKEEFDEFSKQLKEWKTTHETEYTTLNGNVTTFLGTDTTTLSGLKDLIKAVEESDEIATFTAALGNKADKDSVYTKTEIYTNYALKTDIPSLDGYATQTWVEDKGYLTEHQSLNNKQDILVSGTNIKTINGASIIGKGDLTISGGSGASVSSVDFATANTQLNGLNINGTDYKLLDVKVNDGSSLIIGTNRILTSGATSATAIGNCSSSTASGASSTAIGVSSKASGFYSTATGGRSTASGNGSTAIGISSTASGTDSIAIGSYSEVYVPSWFSIDGTTDDWQRTFTLKSTDNIFFRNENVDKTKSTQASYTSGKTLTQVLEEKQDNLNTTQLSAVDSGITSDKVTTYDGYASKITTLEGKPGLDKVGTVTSIKINGTTKTPTSGLVDLGSYLTSHQDISGKQDNLDTTQLSAVNSGITSTKVTTYDGYKATIDNLNDTITTVDEKTITNADNIENLKTNKQDTLVSGTNIKTINGNSLLGSENIVISSGDKIDDTTVSTSSTYSSSKIDSTYAKKDDIPAVPNLDEYAKTEYVDTKVSELVNSAPETLDTLKELSDALGGDANFATTVATQIGNKADKDSVYTKTEIDKNYALKTEIPSLDGYATETWVEDNGYLTNDTLQLKTINGTSVLGSGDITISVSGDSVSSADYASANTQLNGLTINGTNYKLLDVKVNDGSSLIIGGNRKLESGASKAIAIGACGSSVASEYASTAIGYDASANRDYSTAIGVGASASGDASTAIGSYSTAKGNYSTALGSNSRVYVPKWVNFDGESDDFIRTLTLKSTDNIFFRNENVDDTKKTQASYTNGKTLTEVLDTKQDKSTFNTTDLVFYNSDDTVLATVKVYSK